MATLKWAAYTPDDINRKARSLAEALSQTSSEMVFRGQRITLDNRLDKTSNYFKTLTNERR